MKTIAVFFFAVSVVVESACGQGDLRDIPSLDPEVERRSFVVAKDFDVNLFAADPLVRKPVQISFDGAGRLWVASPTMYPQIRPGDKENDRIVVIEDRDGDGQSDHVRVFAEGLMMPTGILPGDGGVYVAHGNEIIHLADTDGDGRADRRQIVIDGFGTEDTHHVIHSLRWGPDGLLYFHQSYYISSHVETPFGVRRMNGGGIWQLDTQTGRLEPYVHGLVNSWGLRFDRFGQSFATDGAGGEGINYVFPAATMVATPHSSRVLHGLNPGSPKHAGLEILSGPAIPPVWRGRLIAADFRANRVNSFVVTEEASGYVSEKSEDLVHSSHVSFRPVDMTIGPDGAIYIADWYSPIIQHGEVDFKDSRRDRIHGRIWRFSAKNAKPVPRPRIEGAKPRELVAFLASSDAWTREHARREMYELARSHKNVVLNALDEWVASLRREPSDDPLRLEALWVFQTIRTRRVQLLRQLMNSPDHRVRAAAIRVLGAWQNDLPNVLALLQPAVHDDHPRVRLEAVHALRKIPSPQSAVIALQALDHPMDRFLDFAIWRTCRDLSDHWLPELESGELDFGGHSHHLSFALQAAETPKIVSRLVELLSADEVSLEQIRKTGKIIAALGNASELDAVLNLALQKEKNDQPALLALLDVLVAAAADRQLQPTTPTDIRTMIEGRQAIAPSVLRLVGLWHLGEFRDQLVLHAQQGVPPLRDAAIESLSDLGEAEDLLTLLDLTTDKFPIATQQLALVAMIRADVSAGASHAIQLLNRWPAEIDVSSIFHAFLEHQDGPDKLQRVLTGKAIPPDFAKIGVRVFRSSALDFSSIVDTIKKAGKIQSKTWNFTDMQRQEFLEEVVHSGDAVRGEQIFRRHNLACLKCHAVAGAGGRVGPDLVSVGASAPVDYLLDSLLKPGKKIKENYTSIVVATDEGQVFSGIRVNQTDTVLTLRTSEDTELSIATESIEQQRTGGSLMPVGLVDELTRRELIDLVCFLSELGKPGPLAIGNANVVRSWKVRPVVADVNKEVAWTSFYSTVSGELPLVEIGERFSDMFSPKEFQVRFEIDVTTPGTVQFEFNGTWRWEDLGERQSPLTLTLTRGRHQVGFLVSDEEIARATVRRVELTDVVGSSAKAQLVGGK